MGKLAIVIIASVVLFSAKVEAKSIGNFKKYNQVTDKEIMIETTTGSKILISAYNNYALGVKYMAQSEEAKLISPSKIAQSKELSGSIYVEELDELMQITTTNNDGLIIKIQKKPFRLSYINKNSKETMLAELNNTKSNDKGDEIIFQKSENETLQIVTSDDIVKSSTQILSGDLLSADKFNELVNPGQKICIESSNGYALVLPKEETQAIELNSKKGLKVLNKTQTPLSYLVIYGPTKSDLIDKYAFNVTEKDNQLTMK